MKTGSAKPSAVSSDSFYEEAITLTQSRPEWAMSNDDRIPPHIRRRMEQAQEGLIGKRRFVTILFADVQGFTALCERRDAEQVTDLMSKYLGRLGELVYEHEGYIDKFMGDCVMALFGAPLAHENDQELAVRCALRMLNAIAELNRQFNEDLSIRIGIHAGVVVAGGVGNNLKLQFTVMGDAVNTAQRLQSAAAPNQIVVGKPVVQATRSLFIYEPLKIEALKGKSEIVEAFAVKGSRGAASEIKERGLRERQLKFIGRKDIISILRPYFKSLQSAHSKSFVLVGDAGIGKSRLKLELKEAVVPQGVKWFDFVCSPSRTQTFMAPIVELVRELSDGDSKSDIFENFKSTGMDFHSQKIELFHLLRSWIKKMAAKSKVVLFFDDLHFADEATIEWMGFMADQATSYLVAGARRSSEGFTPRGVDEILIPPLSADDSLELVRAYLGSAEIPQALTEWIQSSCQGNPYFIEEGLRTLIENQQLVKEGELWKLSPAFNAESLPQSIQSLVTSKVDQLPALDREVLELAAVIGRRFSLKVLSRALENQENLEASLQYLRKKELIFEVCVNAQDIEYIFNQNVTRETIYQGILKRRLKMLHRRIGEAMEAEDHREEEIARHYLASDTKLELGLKYFLSLLGRRAPKAALRDLDRVEQELGLEISPEWAWQLKLKRADLLMEAQDWKKLETLSAQLLLAPDPLKQAWASYWRGQIYLAQEQNVAAEAEFKLSEELEKSKDLRLKIRVLKARVHLRRLEQNWAEAKKISLEAFELMEGRADFGEDAAAFLSDLASIFVVEGDFRMAEKSLEQAQGLAQILQSHSLSGRISYQRGLLAAELAKFSQALSLFRSAFSSFMALGRFRMAAEMLIQISKVYLKLHQSLDAEKNLAQAADLAQMLNDSSVLIEIQELRKQVNEKSSSEIKGS